MNIMPEHQVYEEDFDSKEIYKNYIDKKIILVEEDLEEFKQVAQKEFAHVENSKALEKYEEDTEEIIKEFGKVIDELNELKGQLR